MLEKGAYNSTSTRVKQDGNVPGEFFFFIRFLRKELIEGIALLTASNPSYPVPEIDKALLKPSCVSSVAMRKQPHTRMGNFSFLPQSKELLKVLVPLALVLLLGHHRSGF